MLSKLVTIFSLICLLMLMYGVLINLHKIEDNRCKMTYMFEYPHFMEVKMPEQKDFPEYGMYSYTEGQLSNTAKSMEYFGAPVLFLPGNGGSYKQVRSLASVALRKGMNNKRKKYLDFFTVDFNEEYSALYGGVLNRQVEFARLCVKHILKLYRRHSNAQISVVLIGHSMGGKIAQAVASSMDTAQDINTIIAIAAPIDAPVLSLDYYQQHFYTATNEQWMVNRTVCKESTPELINFTENQSCNYQQSLDHILFLTIGGGIRDTLVQEALTNSVYSDLHAMTHNIPHVWLSVDHLCAVWCLQLVLVVNRFLYAILDSGINFTPSSFLVSKESRFQQALQFFKNNNALSDKKHLAEQLVSNDVRAEDWVEDIRRNFQHRFDHGLTRDRVQMIRLGTNELYEFLQVDVRNVDDKGLVFGCAANEIYSHMRYCSYAMPLDNYTELLPSRSDFNHIAIQLNLHHLLEKNPTWTHLLLKFHKTTEPFQFSVDISNSKNQMYDIHMPNWYNYFEHNIAETNLGSTVYRVNLHGMIHKFQSLALYLHTESCLNHDSSITAKIRFPWAEQFNKYMNFHQTNHYVVYVYMPDVQPNGSNATVQITLHLDPNCKYNLSYGQSLGVTMARIIQQFAQWIPAHCTIIILLALRYQILTSGNERHGGLRSTLCHTSSFFVITASRVLAKLALTFRVFPQPDSYDLPIILSFLMHGAALGVLLILNGSLWLAIVACGNFGYKLMLRMISVPIPTMSPVIISCIRNYPITIGIVLTSVALASCGEAALICAVLVYFLMLSKMYEDYLAHSVLKTAQNIAKKIFGTDISAKSRAKSHTNKDTLNDNGFQQHGKAEHISIGLERINFHFSLFLLLIIATVINFPCFLTWAKSYRFSTILKPDASLIPSLVIIGSLSVLWQTNCSLHMRGHRIVTCAMYAVAVICILYCRNILFRLNFVISGEFLMIAAYQLLGSR